MCEICTENPTLRKVDIVGRWSMKKLLKELTEEKVRLLHGVCHFAFTLTQFKNGKLVDLSKAMKEIYEEEINEENNDNDNDDGDDNDSDGDGKDVVDEEENIGQ